MTRLSAVKRGHIALFVSLLVAACAGPMDPPPAGGDQMAIPLPGEDTCGRAEYAALVGQDATALERVLIMRQVRVIQPNSMMTMDYSPDRINFMIDEAGKIARITCG